MQAIFVRFSQEGLSVQDGSAFVRPVLTMLENEWIDCRTHQKHRRTILVLIVPRSGPIHVGCLREPNQSMGIYFWFVLCPYQVGSMVNMGLPKNFVPTELFWTIWTHEFYYKRLHKACTWCHEWLNYLIKFYKAHDCLIELPNFDWATMVLHCQEAWSWTQDYNEILSNKVLS